MRRAVTVPIVPIIWADDAGGSHLLLIMAGGAVAVMLPVLYAGHGGTAQFVSFSVACSVLVLLACIDVRVYLLPDALTQPLLWLGLVCAWTGLGISAHDSVGGVITGYVLMALPRSLWLRWRGVEGVGRGDVKLLAALGAWLGAFGITHVLTVACITGVVFAMVHQRRWRASGAYPFGPFIVIGGVAELLLRSGVHLRLWS